MQADLQFSGSASLCSCRASHAICKCITREQGGGKGHCMSLSTATCSHSSLVCLSQTPVLDVRSCPESSARSWGRALFRRIPVDPYCFLGAGTLIPAHFGVSDNDPRWGPATMISDLPSSSLPLLCCLPRGGPAFCVLFSSQPQHTKRGLMAAGVLGRRIEN